jgi:acetyl esterase
MKGTVMRITSILLPASALFFTAHLAHAQADNAMTPPKADPQMQKVLDALASLGGKPITTLSPQEARKQPTPADAVKKVLKEQGKRTAPDAGVTVKEMTIPGPHGKLPIHVFQPEGKGPFPVMLYYHGGGFVIADTDTYEASPRALANKANAVIVSVDYHRAPERPFPAAANDAFAAYQWVLQHAAQINGDPQRVAVGGESAGGNLAAVVSQMARDKGVTLPVHQLLVYPMAGHDFNTPSYKRNADAKPLNKPMMEWFYKHYLGKQVNANNPYAVPLAAKSLKNLPPATIITAEIDPLLSEGKTYADRLKQDGVKVTYKEYSGVTHEFFGMAKVVDKAKDAQDLAAQELRQAFATGTRSR